MACAPSVLPLATAQWFLGALAMGRAWRSSASRANGSDGMPTPVDYFRHHPTSHRFLKETVDLPSFVGPFDPSRHS